MNRFEVLFSPYNDPSLSGATESPFEEFSLGDAAGARLAFGVVRWSLSKGISAGANLSLRLPHGHAVLFKSKALTGGRIDSLSERYVDQIMNLRT